MMRAIRVHESGGIDTMRLDEIPRPVPGAGEMLVAVKAAGVGPSDRLVREGRNGLGQKLPLTLGSDFSGTVAALGVDLCRCTRGGRRGRNGHAEAGNRVEQRAPVADRGHPDADQVFGG
jgi:NADPH:quinone reductase-like Zn-dependent oxidoreductase